MYFPQMIEAGMVYKAIPPLYSIKQGNKNRYFTEQIDIVRYIQKLFLQKYEMNTVKKQPLQNKDDAYNAHSQKNIAKPLSCVRSQAYLQIPLY